MVEMFLADAATTSMLGPRMENHAERGAIESRSITHLPTQLRSVTLLYVNRFAKNGIISATWYDSYRKRGPPNPISNPAPFKPTRPALPSHS